MKSWACAMRAASSTRSRVLGAPQTDYTRTLLAAVPRIALPSV